MQPPTTSNPQLAGVTGAFIDRQRGRLVQIVQDLLRIPSENTPPVGDEEACQKYVAAFVRKLGFEPDVYQPDTVPGIQEHPLYFAGRKYAHRPNLAIRKIGAGGGRSLVLSGHIDTVPQGTQPWTRDPFGAQVEGDRIYGRGANDMKAGIGANLFVLEALTKMGIRLKGDLCCETVVDEEFGGSNGTLAGRVRGYLADAAVISEPTSLRVCPAQRGARTAHITLSGVGGVLNAGMFPSGIARPLRYFLTHVEAFAKQRRAGVQVHELYEEDADPVPVSITKVSTGPWGWNEPITVPDKCQVEMYWQTMPGETQSDVEEEFFRWLDTTVRNSGGLMQERPDVSFPIRWLPGSSISTHDDLVTTLAASAATTLGRQPLITGMEGPCDLYVFQQGFNMPAVLWGASGGNTHGADEYVEIDSLIKAAKALLHFVVCWCGVDAVS